MAKKKDLTLLVSTSLCWKKIHLLSKLYGLSWEANTYLAQHANVALAGTQKTGGDTYSTYHRPTVSQCIYSMSLHL